MKKDLLLEDFKSRQLKNTSAIQGGGNVPWYVKAWYGTTSHCVSYNHGNCSTAATTDWGAENTETTQDVIQ